MTEKSPDAKSGIAAKCGLCGQLENHAAACKAGHQLCALCFRAYSRAFVKMASMAILCSEDGCSEAMAQKQAVEPTARIQPVRLVTLHPNEVEFRAVSEKFGRTLDAKWIQSIFRVDNQPLKLIFEACKARIEKEGRVVGGKDIGANEVLLFHATSRAACGGIVREGFDMRRAGDAHGTALGPGAYFAADASMSHGYSKIDGKGQRCMLVCRVLLGNTKGRDSKASGGQFVVNREQQLLPAYMIIYQDPNDPLKVALSGAPV